jgi:hypothetical protein
MKWAGHVKRMAEMKNMYILTRKSERMITIEGTRRRWGYNIKMDLKEI